MKNNIAKKANSSQVSQSKALKNCQTLTCLLSSYIQSIDFNFDILKVSVTGRSFNLALTTELGICKGQMLFYVFYIFLILTKISAEDELTFPTSPNWDEFSNSSKFKSL